LLPSLISQIEQPVIVAAIVSAIVALAILGFKEGYLEPRRWRKNIQVSNLEKRLQVYGELISVLESCKRKAMRQDLNKSDSPTPEKVHSHLLENPFDGDRLQIIFEKSHHLLSSELLEEWYKFVREDEYFALNQARRKGEGNLLVDFRNMQTIAEKENAALRNEYDNIA
jgi:hypothetical protein